MSDDIIIFLDIDGVLNDHTSLENNYCGTKRECVSEFNRILDAIPDAKIVISSAWRYMILRGSMTLNGFEMLLLTHGIKCYGKVIGHTVADGPGEPSYNDSEAWQQAGLIWRSQQIMKWVNENNVTRFIVLDDLQLDLKEHYSVDGKFGLTRSDARKIIEWCKKL